MTTNPPLPRDYIVKSVFGLTDDGSVSEKVKLADFIQAVKLARLWGRMEIDFENGKARHSFFRLSRQLDDES